MRGRFLHRGFALLGCLLLGGPTAWAAVAEAGAQAESPENTAQAEPEEATLLTRRSGVSNAEGLFWVTGTAEFRTKLVTDDDPASGQSRMMRYMLKTGVRAFEGGRPFVRMELRQHFFPEEGEQFEFRDLQLGLDYGHSVSADAIGLKGRSFTFLHRASLWTPTSRTSRSRDLILAPELMSNVDLELIDGLSIGFLGRARYQWHRFADRAGPGAPMNTQLVLDGLVRMEYVPLSHPTYGTLSVGLDAWVSYDKHYPSRDDFEDRTGRSVVTQWNQSYGWDAYVNYTPIRYVSVGLSVERGGRVRRDGGVNYDLFFGHRDEIDLALNVTGRY